MLVVRPRSPPHHIVHAGIDSSLNNTPPNRRYITIAALPLTTIHFSTCRNKNLIAISAPPINIATEKDRNRPRNPWKTQI